MSSSSSSSESASSLFINTFWFSNMSRISCCCGPSRLLSSIASSSISIAAELFREALLLPIPPCELWKLVSGVAKPTAAPDPLLVRLDGDAIGVSAIASAAADTVLWALWFISRPIAERSQRFISDVHEFPSRDVSVLSATCDGRGPPAL